MRAAPPAGGPKPPHAKWIAQLIRDAARGAATLRALSPERRLALEIAVDEVAEVAELERQWMDAEAIAEIADGMLSTTPELDDHLRRLKSRASPEG